MRLARLDHTFFENELRPQLGSLLMQKGLITEAELQHALDNRLPGELVGEALVRMRIAFEDEIGRVLAEQQGIDFADIGTNSVDPSAAIELPPELGREIRAIPVRYLPNGALLVAVADPLDERVTATLTEALRRPFEIVVATPSGISYCWTGVERKIGLARY